MKKYGKLSKSMAGIFIIVCIVTAAGLWGLAAYIRSSILHTALPPAEFLKDTVIIHFTHGSVPKKGCPDQRKVEGGYFGGHIEIQSREALYGFLSETKPVHIFPRKRLNAKFERNELSVWKEKTRADRISSIHLPLTAGQKKNIDSILESYLRMTPYDYAFFGQRCASSTIGILADAGIFKNFSSAGLVIAFFYPRPLKSTMISFAKKNHLKIDFQKGSECRSWE